MSDDDGQKYEGRGNGASGAKEEKSVDRASRLTAPLIYEVIRRDGTEEMTRPMSSLVFSGLAAGILMSFSILGEAIFRTYLPVDSSAAFLLENLGYSLGFMIVILGRQQLFTENTITTVLPILANPCREHVVQTARLWGLVLAANVVGAFIAALFIAYSSGFEDDVVKAVGDLSRHSTEFPALTGFAKAIPAGVLVAGIVWMLPTQPRSPFFLILTFTWLIAAGDFLHIIAGSVEMAFLMVQGELGLIPAIFRFFIPVLLGNVVGGTIVFTLIVWAQVKAEIKGA
ncbi:formate/nitrite transporter FocA (FNT family) [Palleronia aestuarii]|uniref:Formate/nitrite transporter FocA (FNT family) n=1 Tax=Palleronia aestuarii TaxID=568105 RepID=A0A2W7NEP9_9RHOB|nr:formate/nitrite transporter family protein [Palleronia aestuarii]PZX18905.1 formate/nitrite transporter FocA (FNT family) [Palleronia aestuarii]